jgi:hypothetical protein
MRLGISGWEAVSMRAMSLIAAFMAMSLLILHAGRAAADEPVTPDGLCNLDGANNWIIRQAVEAECLQRYPGRAERSGERLTIPLANGESKTFLSDSEACQEDSVAECRIFTFVGYIAELNRVVINEACYEFCHDYFIVSVSDGDTIKFEDPPHLSPSRDRLIVVAADLASGLTMPDIQLFDIRSGQLLRIFEYSSKGTEAWSFRAWNEEGIIDLDVDILSDITTCPGIPQVAPIKLTRAGDVWQLGPRPSCR